jgi:hypothetical protein
MKRLILLSISLIIFLCAAAPSYAQTQQPCATAYGGALPTPLPRWLQTFVQADDLHTENRYDLLAGQMVRAKLVDGSACPSGGLNLDGSPNACGLEAAQAEVLTWQNRYDGQIATAGQQNSVPPFVMKAVIAVESQFWPGSSWVKGEIGLGQMTEFGADLLLANQPARYQQVCRQALRPEVCDLPYLFQPASNQSMLRGLVLKSIDATCSSCTGGINLAKGEHAVDVVAETLAASCVQSGRVISWATGHRPADRMSYEDFWRFVLANYHSGAGCMFQALQHAGNSTGWSGIAANLSPGCASGSAYIRRIEEGLKP